MTVEPLRAGDPPSIGAYRLLGRLGTGGMGQVFLGRARSGRMVAVKVVRDDLAGQDRFRERFRAEVRAAQRVGGMWTAPVLDCDTESAVPWVATAYVAGVPLQTVVESLHGPLPERSVRALAHGLGQALTQIHGAGLIHRDLKPSNVMVSLEGPKVIDFGIARAVDAGTALTRTGAMIGSPGYMPPEQIRGERLTGAADVFALGVVLAYAVTGQSPFSWDAAGVHTVLYRVMHAPPQLGPEDGPLRGALRGLVARCLAKEPGERPSPAEIVSLAKAGAGTGHWLPSELTARLGQDAAALLALDGPSRVEPTVALTEAGPLGVHEAQGTPPAVSPDQTTYVSAETQRPVRSGAPTGAGPCPDVPPRPREVARTPRATWTTWTGPRHNRRFLGAVSAVLTLALAGWLAVETWGPDTPREGDGRPGSAQTPLTALVPQEVRDAGGLTVHVSDKGMAVLDTRREDHPTGFETELIQAVGKRLHVDVRLTVHEHDEEAVAAIGEKGRGARAELAMAELPDTAAHRKEWHVDMVDHFQSGLGAISKHKLDSLSEVCGTTIATYSDDDLQEQIRYQADCPQPLKFLPMGHRGDMVDAVLKGRASAVVLQYPLAVEQAGFKEPDTGLTVSLVRDARGPRGIAVPAGRPELRAAVARSLEALIEDGTYTRLLRRWHLLDAAVEGVRTNGT